LIRKCLFSFVLLIAVSPLYALPRSFEIWFLSPPKIARIFNSPEYVYSKFIAQAGETFFDPQQGWYGSDGEIQKAAVVDDGPAAKVGNQKHLSDYQNDMISCDKGYYFDLYCGKAKKEKRGPSMYPLEVWVDTSSSLRAVDPMDGSGQCFRRSFVKRLRDKCKSNKVLLSTFDTSLKSMGADDTACISHGLNDQKRMIDWIQSNYAKKMIMITDIAEYTKELSDFIEAKGGIVRGGDPSKSLTAKDMLDLVSEASSFCK